jgi:predicted Zn-dependent peptidase
MDIKPSIFDRFIKRVYTEEELKQASRNIERYNLGLDYLLEYPNLIMRITREEILNFSRLYLSNEKLVISTAGS